MDVTTGALYKRGKLWYWEYRVDGRRQYKSLKTASKEIAIAKRRTLLADLRDQVGGLNGNNYPLSIWKDLVGTSYKAKGRPTTFPEVMRAVREFLAVSKASTLSGITSPDIDALVSQWRARGLKAQTINTRIGLLQAAYWRVMGKQARNPFREYGRLREDDSREVLPLESEMVARYLEAAKQYNEEAWRQMMFLAYVGCRTGTMYKLRVRDVEWENDNLHLTLWKTTQSLRDRFADVPIPKPLVPILRDLTAGRQPDDLVFREPPYWSWLEHQMRYMGRRYRLPHAHPHQLRHSWATKALEATGDLRAVMESGGWSNLKMLQRYTKPNRAAKRRVMDAVQYHSPERPTTAAPA